MELNSTIHPPSLEQIHDLKHFDEVRDASWTRDEIGIDFSG
jgi:hypothetical protein